MVKSFIPAIAAAFLAGSAAVSADVIPFNFSLNSNNTTVSYSMQLYPWYNPTGLPDFELSGSSTNVAGIMDGNVTTDANGISQLYIHDWTASTTSPMYADGYVQGIHVEASIPQIGMGCNPMAMGTDSDGSFNSYINAYITPGSQIHLRVADLINYDLPLYAGVPAGRDITGDVTLVDGVPRVTMTLFYRGHSYLGDYGYDGTLVGQVVITSIVPEPSSVLLALMPGLLALRRRVGGSLTRSLT
jgi:hypothetical protein